MSAKDRARQEYFNSLEVTAATITDRFSQESINVYSALASLLKQAIKGRTCIIDDRLTELYTGDFDFTQLATQLSLIHNQLSGHKIQTLKDFAEWLKHSPTRSYMGQVEKLVKLLLTLPATNASSERTFSAMKRIKTYMRNSMGQKRLNSCMLLHIYKEINDEIDPREVIKQFVQSHPYRIDRIAVL